MRITLWHFKPAEFRGWYDKTSPRLLILLDLFREHWGRPVIISPARGAIGRRRGPEATSQHNFDRWGEVRAVDVMPRDMTNPERAREAVAIAKLVGFTGYGVYPHWSPHPGMHLDVRESRDVGDPAIWGALDVSRATQDQLRRGHVVGSQVYLGIDEVLRAF